MNETEEAELFGKANTARLDESLIFRVHDDKIVTPGVALSYVSSSLLNSLSISLHNSLTLFTLKILCKLESNHRQLFGQYPDYIALVLTELSHERL